jgi:hypothetical protein
MRSRKLRWALTAGLVALAGVAAFALWPRPNRVTRENCARIRQGMTRAEVDALLGPPGDYRTGPVDYDRGLVPLKIAPITMPWETSDDDDRWAGDSAYLAVRFDPEGRVGSWYVVPTSKAAQSPLGNLLWRLGRQWRRWSP